MKKFSAFILTAVLMLSLYGCSGGISVDTGIPDVKMQINEIAEEKETETADGKCIVSCDKEGNIVKTAEYAENGELKTEKYTVFHSDGRVFQQLTKYHTGEKAGYAELHQYKYDASSLTAEVTLWAAKDGIYGSETVVHTLSDKNSQLQIAQVNTYIYSANRTVQIRAISELCRDRTLYTQYVAGKVIETAEWLVPQQAEKGETVTTNVPGIILHLAPAVETEEELRDDGSGYLIDYDDKGRAIKVESYMAGQDMLTKRYTAYDEKDRIFATVQTEYRDDKPYQSRLTQYKYHPDSLDVTITYAVVWGNGYGSDSVLYTMEQPDSHIHVGSSGFSGTENYFTVKIGAIGERRTGDFEKWTYYENGRPVKADRYEYPAPGTETEHSVSASYTF